MISCRKVWRKVKYIQNHKNKIKGVNAIITGKELRKDFEQQLQKVKILSKCKITMKEHTIFIRCYRIILQKIDVLIFLKQQTRIFIYCTYLQHKISNNSSGFFQHMKIKFSEYLYFTNFQALQHNQCVYHSNCIFLNMESQSQTYNWPSVINFIQKQYSKNSLREKQWMLQKRHYQDKINTLVAQQKANQAIQADLLKRIKLLEVALLQQRYNNKTHATLNIATPQTILQKYPHLQTKIKQTHHDFLQRILTDLGIHQNFQQSFRPKKQIQIAQLKINSTNFQHNTKQLMPKISIQAHLDSIRQMYRDTNHKYLATISEDCLIKLWNYDLLEECQSIDTAITLRQHTGPLFCVTGGPNPYNPEKQVLFTSGSEGYIKVWGLQNLTDLNQTISKGSWPNSSQQKSEDHAVWQIKYEYQKLLTSSSDGIVRIFSLSETEDGTQLIGKQQQKFKDKQFNHTSIEWISERSFLAGCGNAPKAIMWDINNNKILQKYNYEIEKLKQPYQSQINNTKYLKQKKLITLGCQDSFLRFYDFNSPKIVSKIKTMDSVSCISERNSWQVVVGCQNGGIYIWDLRKFTLIQQHNKSHLRKYDEGVHHILGSKKQILTCGADGIINIYKF